MCVANVETIKPFINIQSASVSQINLNKQTNKQKNYKKRLIINKPSTNHNSNQFNHCRGTRITVFVNKTLVIISIISRL